MKKNSIWIAIVSVCIIGIVGFIAVDSMAPGPHDAFAQCLTENEVKMYGAFWCPHCQETKDDFGASFKYVDYVECSLPNRSGQTQVCKDQGITGYPTWDIKGERVSGYQPLETLSELSGCSI